MVTWALRKLHIIWSRVVSNGQNSRKCNQVLPNYVTFAKKWCRKGNFQKVPLNKMPVMDTPFKKVLLVLIYFIHPPSEQGHCYIFTPIVELCRPIYPDSILIILLAPKQYRRGADRHVQQVGRVNEDPERHGYSIGDLSRWCARIIFQRDWRAPLKIYIQFKVNKIEIQFKVNKIKIQFKVTKIDIQFKVNKIKIQFKVNKINILFPDV